ncbi:MAG TPA: N-acetylmuramoyl-L-alanine amidase [Bacillota bacterium]
MAGVFAVWRLDRRWLAVVAVLALFLAGWRWQAARAAAEQAALASFLAGRVVVVDPGHGGPDPGASSNDGLLEKDVVLAVAQKLGGLLAAAGAEVYLTRDGDVDLSGMPDASLRERWRAAHRRRVEIAREHGAEIVVSIHANAVPSPRWYGGQVFHRPGADDATRSLAQHIQRELRHITSGTERQVSDHVDHYLLNNVDVPAVTVEVGFLSNPREARLLARDDYRRRLAWAIFVGIAHFFAERERPGLTR